MTEVEAMKAAESVSEDALWDRLMTMAKYGATPNGGVNRQALSNEDVAARQQMAEWAKEHGFRISTDDVGNLFVRRAGRDDTLPPVMTGSHMDSQPKGGKFDGIYGVMAGLEALAAMERAAVATQHPIEVVAWMNEEGSRFQPGLMGSAIFAGRLAVDEVMDIADKDGVTIKKALADTLAATPEIETRATGFPVAAYIETHIEQGPILEAENQTIGVVQGIQGSRWFAVDVIGKEAHAGTSPMKSRKDALKAAAEMVAALEALTEDETDTVRCTIGRFECFPGSPNTVPGRVFFTIDFRHPNAEIFEKLSAEIEPTCKKHARNCDVEVKRTMNAPPTVFRKSVVDLIRDEVESIGSPFIDMPSGGGHDAQNMHEICPTGMIFIPCKDGISHNEAESATPSDCAAGTRVLAATLVELANGKAIDT